ncbi:MAG: PAS domain S-box protein [Candidatus Omnitrophota bacterium]
MTDKTKEELIEEIKFLQKRIAELEILDSARKQQQQQQQQQQDIRYLAAVVRDSNDAVMIQDFEGQITAWNHGAELVYGYSEKEALQMNIRHLTPPDKAAEQEEFIRRLIEGEAVTSFETRRVAKDGRILDVWLTVTKLLDDMGKPIGIASTERDITERKRAEEVLQENERSLAQAQQLAQLGNWKFIPATGKTVWSKEMFRIYGLEPANEAPPFEVLARMVHEEDRQRWGEAIKEGRRTGRFHNLEYRIIRPDGQCRWLLAYESMQPESKETPLVFYGTVLDITERKQAEEELQKEKQFIKNIINTAQVIMLVLDKEGRIVTFNPYMEQISGYRLEEVKGKDWFETFLPEEIRTRVHELFLKAIGDIQTKGNVDFLIARDGRKLQIEWYDKTIKGPDGSIEGLLSIGQDITERKRAEEALQESENRYRFLFNEVPLSLSITTLDGKALLANQGYEELTGYTIEEFIALKDVSEMYADPSQRKQLMSLLQKKGKVHNFEAMMKRKDGTVYNALMNVNFIKLGSEQVVLTTVRDITERKKIEEKESKHTQELEVFYKASVGREERIIELKKEVERLKKELGR